jgi:NADP-dependent aldehyde dehydrogenase
MDTQPILIAGKWQPAQGIGAFQSENPATRQPLSARYPISSWHDCDAALVAATRAADAMARLAGMRIAQFLTRYAERIEAHKDAIVETAHAETALAVAPRLADVELPRTTSQLRQAAAAAADGGWAMPTIDTQLNIRSCFEPIGPVGVLGPNNFPLAFGSISGGDFAAAIAAGNPVIAKANTSHPATTQRLAEQAQGAAEDTDMPAGIVQLVYRVSHDDGARLVADSRLGATAYTGSRAAGLALKAAADAAGKPIYLELSAINPIIILPGALRERCQDVADQFTQSCLMGTGQFCTNPGLVLLVDGAECQQFTAAVVDRFRKAPVGTLLSSRVASSLEQNIAKLRDAGAHVLVGGQPADGAGYSYANTLLRVSGSQFLADPHALQTEAFGNASLLVVAQDERQLAQIVDQLEGSLTGCIYSDTKGRDEEAYQRLAPRLGRHVGRMLNDKMPTGVAVTAAMNHGGPFPATGHPGFTAVGIPAALRRFAVLRCYDNVRHERLPACLRNTNPTGNMWRLIDGQWSQDSLT